MAIEFIWFIVEVVLHALILMTICGYLFFALPLPDLQWELLFYFSIAVTLHLMQLFIPDHPVTSVYHFPRLYQLYCFGHCFHRFALFNLKYFMKQRPSEVIYIILTLVGNFSVVTFDVIGIDISGGWFIFNMTTNAAMAAKINNQFKYPVLITYVIAWVFVLSYYLILKELYIFWYVCYTIFVILRIESLALEQEGTPVVT